MPDLPLRIELLPGTTPGGRVLRLNGPLTLSNCFEFQNLVRADRDTNLIVDLSAVPYVDSACSDSNAAGTTTSPNRLVPGNWSRA